MEVVAPGKMDRHSSTTGTQQAHTISKPNIKSICTAVATILHTQIAEDIQEKKAISPDSDYFVFSEEKYFKDNPEEFDEERKELMREPPSVDNIYEFIRNMYDCALFSAECFIMSLVYVNRMLSTTGSPLIAENWRPVILCSLLVAQKVWDDKNLTTADFAYIYPFFTNDQLNSLELSFLQLIKFNTYVKGQLYHKYYFELRSLVKNEDLALTPLDAATAANLEAHSQHVQEREQARANESKFNKTEIKP
jgi:hypothetical protein